MQLDVLAHNGKTTGRKVDLPDAVFGIVPNEHVVYLAVKQFLAAQRQGTHKTKGRSEVKGSSRKLHKQKGTGGSRKGNIRNPLYKGGGTIFGPQPRDYSFKLNKKVRDLARVSVLSEKASKGSVLVVEDLKIAQPKTKEVLRVLDNLSLADKKVLVLTRSDVPRADFLYLALRNLPAAKGIPLSHASVYDLLGAEILLFEESLATYFSDTAAEKSQLTQEKTEEAQSVSERDLCSHQAQNDAIERALEIADAPEREAENTAEKGEKGG